MKNPFEKLFSGGQSEQSGEAQAENVPLDKEKTLSGLREWRKQVEAGINMNTERQGGSQDQEQLNEIDRQIAELEAVQ